MAKTKSELLGEAKALGLDVNEKSKVAEIQAAIDGASTAKNEPEVKEVKKEVKATAKAGKHSAKGIKEAEQKQAKIEHQKHGDSESADEQPKPKKAIKPTRSRLERRGKKFKEAAKQIDKNKEYSLNEALELAKSTSTTKFDASVELHIRLGVDPKQADQNIRGTVILPGGSGKTVRVAVFGDVDDVKKAKDAGADVAAGDEFLQQLDKGEINFDVLIATPQQMAKLGKYARVLGPKGLMPNPKSGTVTKNVAQAVKEAKAGKVEYRVDSNGIVHLSVGKVSFSVTDLAKNAEAVLGAIKAAKPASLKGGYMVSTFVTTSMGPSIKLNSASL